MIFSTFCALASGDKPRHYKRSISEWVGVGFIPTHELACTDNDSPRIIAQFRVHYKNCSAKGDKDDCFLPPLGRFVWFTFSWKVSLQKIHIILFFSPRTARTFVRLVRQAGLADRCETMIAICLSSAVAEAASALIWGSVHIAATPDRAAMLDSIH